MTSELLRRTITLTAEQSLSGVAADATKCSHNAAAINSLTCIRKREQMVMRLGKVFPAELGTR